MGDAKTDGKSKRVSVVVDTKSKAAEAKHGAKPKAADKAAAKPAAKPAPKAAAKHGAKPAKPKSANAARN